MASHVDRQFWAPSGMLMLVCLALSQGCSTGTHSVSSRASHHDRAPRIDVSLVEAPSSFRSSSVSPPESSKEHLRWSQGVCEWTVTLSPAADAYAEILLATTVWVEPDSHHTWLSLELQPSQLAHHFSVELLAVGRSLRSAEPLDHYAVAHDGDWGFYVVPLGSFLPPDTAPAPTRFRLAGIRLSRTDAAGPRATVTVKKMTLRRQCLAVPPHYRQGEIEGAMARLMP